jgi:hypothetical protein
MTQTDITNRIIENFDPIVPCEWLPDREVRLSEYNQMITARVRLQAERLVSKYMKEYMNAKPIRTKKFSD